MTFARILARCIGFAALILLVLAASSYAGVCAWFAWNAHSLVFVATGGNPVAPDAAGLGGFAAVAIATEDGERLVGWWAPPKPGHGAVLLLIGNGGLSLSDMTPLLADLAANGFGVLGIEYRGNAGSTGTPSEAGLRADARAAFDFIHSAAPRAKIAVYGHSFGTGVAVALAHDRPIAGILLNSPYASIARLFERGGLPIPYALLLGDPFDSAAVIGKLLVPVMILHGTADRSIPIAEARRLYAAAREPKTMIEVEGAGHGGVWVGAARERALAALAAWTAPDPQ